MVEALAFCEDNCLFRDLGPWQERAAPALDDHLTVVLVHFEAVSSVEGQPAEYRTLPRWQRRGLQNVENESTRMRVKGRVCRSTW